MGKRHFQKSWLENTDSNNQLVRVWCVPKDDFTVTCKVCSTDIIIQHMGFSALRQHSENKSIEAFLVWTYSVKENLSNRHFCHNTL